MWNVHTVFKSEMIQSPAIVFAEKHEINSASGGFSVCWGLSSLVLASFDHVPDEQIETVRDRRAVDQPDMS